MTTTESRTLPEHVIQQFIDVVGRDGVLLTDEERDQYRDPYWFQGDRSYDSSAVLFPTSTEQVQQIVRIANENDVPVWASSQGRNNGYGGAAPPGGGPGGLPLPPGDRGPGGK